MTAKPQYSDPGAGNGRPTPGRLQWGSPDQCYAAISEALDSVDTALSLRRGAFEIALILRQGFNDPIEALRAASASGHIGALCEEAGWDPEYLSEEVFEAWPKVLAGKSGDPIAAAIDWARAQTLPAIKGAWPPFMSARRDAALTLRICEYLSRNGTRPFFLPCRKLAEALECDHDRAARLLRLLVENGYLEKKGTAGKRTAQRYQVRIPRAILTESTEITDTTESTESTEAQKKFVRIDTLHMRHDCTNSDRKGSIGASGPDLDP